MSDRGERGSRAERGDKGEAPRGEPPRRPKTGRNNCNVPQEIVTPTRRDVLVSDPTPPPTNIDWLSVSEYNCRYIRDRARKAINLLPENNEYIEIDSGATSESGNRFVPVRPQPRTLGLRHKDGTMENQEESPYSAFLSGHSPHSSHAAVMIVNPTTPNQSNHNLSSVSNQNNSISNHSRNVSNNAMHINNTAPVGPYPMGNKSNNLSNDNQESLFQNGGIQHNACSNDQLTDSMMQGSRSKAIRTLGDSMVSSCPDTSRVEQRLGQIQEYIQVTASLVESMRNSEDDEYDQEHNSDIDELVQTLSDLKDSEKKLKDMLSLVLKNEPGDGDPSAELTDKCEITDITDESLNVIIASEYEQIDETNHDSVNFYFDKGIDDVVSKDDDELEIQEVPRSSSVQSGTSLFSDNYLCPSDLEPKMDASQSQMAAALQVQKYLMKMRGDGKDQHVSQMNNGKNENLHNGPGSYQESIDYANIIASQTSGRTYNPNQIGVATTLPHSNDRMRSRDSTSRDRVIVDNLSSAPSDNGRSKMLSSSELSQLDMLRDLQLRKQHIENQVAKIQSLHATSASLSEAMIEGESDIMTPENNRDSNWRGSEESLVDADLAMTNLRSKLAAVNVVKMELEKLKSMLRTVDSIQNNFGVVSNTEDDSTFDQAAQIDNQYEGHNRTDSQRLSESPFNNTASGSTHSTSGNSVREGHTNINTLKNQNPAHGLCRLQNCISSNKCTNVSDRHGDIAAELATIHQITQQMKQETIELTNERLRLKHALNRDVNSSSASIKSDDKKKTNSATNYPPTIGPIERKQMALKAELEAKKKQLERLMSKEVDHRTNQQSINMETENVTKSSMSSSEKENIHEASCSIAQHSHSAQSAEDDAYHSHVRSEGDNGYSSDPEDEDVYSPSPQMQLNINQLNERESHKLQTQNALHYDAAQSLDNAMKHGNCSHSNIFGTPVNEKQRNKEQQLQIHNVPQDRPLQEPRTAKDIFNAKRIVSEGDHESKNASDSIHVQRANTQERDNMIAHPQPVNECVVNLPVSSNSAQMQKKQSTMREQNVINNPINVTEPCSRPDSGSSSGDQELTDVPNPMPPLSLRHQTMKSAEELNNPETEPQPWNNPHSESQISMWWHNKANQLQQQLEMTSNLCQSLLQDRHTSLSSVSTLNTLPQAVGNPNLLIPNPTGTSLSMPGNINEHTPGSWWTLMQQQQLALQQQQLAAQQQQLASTSWGNSQCLQHLLSQQREILSLRNTINNLEERMQLMSFNVPRSQSTPPTINFNESQPVRPQWNPPNPLDPNLMNQMHPSNTPWFAHSNPLNYNLLQDRSKRPADYIPNNYPVNQYQFDPGAPYNSGFVMGNPAHVHLNSNMMAAHMLHNPINSNAFMNFNGQLPVSGTINAAGAQTLMGQNTALNNQVPPGNRANNYWDNFRSYSRQNLLSGSSKVNADTSQTHNPHPLAERSHNALHAGSTPAVAQLQSINTPKRNINNQLMQNQLHNNSNSQTENGSENVSRARRNILNETVLHMPPDVLNVNQNINSSSPLAVENNTDDNSLNVNINSISTSAGSSNLSRSNGATKKKSSSKVPAKNSKYSDEYIQKRNVEHPTAETNELDPNLTSTSSANDQKSTSKLFDLLRENVYSEVSALISANESRPHFLIQLFRDLRQISSDTLRQRTLQSIQELVSRYLANESEHYNVGQLVSSTSAVNGGNLYAVTSANNNDLGLFSLDRSNDIVKFLFMHSDEPCTDRLLERLACIILSIADQTVCPAQLNQCLHEHFNKYPGCKLVDISDDLVMALTRLPLQSGYPNVEDVLLDLEGAGVRVTKKPPEEPSTNESQQSERAEACDVSQLDSQNVSETPTCSALQKQADVGVEENAIGCSRSSASELKMDLIENVESCNGDLAEADQSRHRDDLTISSTSGAAFDGSLPDIVDMDEQTPTEAEAEWLRTDRVPPRPETDACPGNQSDHN